MTLLAPVCPHSNRLILSAGLSYGGGGAATATRARAREIIVIPPSPGVFFLEQPSRCSCYSLTPTAEFGRNARFAIYECSVFVHPPGCDFGPAGQRIGQRHPSIIAHFHWRLNTPFDITFVFVFFISYRLSRQMCREIFGASLPNKAVSEAWEWENANAERRPNRKKALLRTSSSGSAWIRVEGDCHLSYADYTCVCSWDVLKP